MLIYWPTLYTLVTYIYIFDNYAVYIFMLFFICDHNRRHKQERKLSLTHKLHCILSKILFILPRSRCGVPNNMCIITQPACVCVRACVRACVCVIEKMSAHTNAFLSRRLKLVGRQEICREVRCCLPYR